MSGFIGPKDMESLLENAEKTLKSLENDTKFPRDKIQRCSGLILLNSMELGVFFSGQDASGVLLAYRDGKWSPPLAVAMTGVGVGSLGFAEKQTIMVLNQAAVDSITSNPVPIKFGADVGLTNYIGGEVGGDTGIGMAGLESSYAFSNSEGGIVSLEIHSCIVKPKDKINREYYPDKTDSEVLAGMVDIPPGSKASQLMENVAILTPGPDTVRK